MKRKTSTDQTNISVADTTAHNHVNATPISAIYTLTESGVEINEAQARTQAAVSTNRISSTPWGKRLCHAILWLEPFWLVALAPSLLLRELFWDLWLHPWLILALFLFWPLRFVIERRLAPSTPLNLPIFGLLLWTPAGFWVATDSELAWHTAGFLLLGIAFYFAFLNWRPMQRRPWLVALCIAVCGLLLSAIGPDLLLRISTEFLLFSEEVVRSKPIDIFGWGETVNPNVLGGILLLPIPLLTALAMRTSWAKRRWLPPFLVFIIIPMLATVILTQSRGSYLAVMIAMICVLVLRWPWSGVAVGVALVTVAVVLTIDGTVLFLGTFGSDGTITSFSGRLEIWQGSLQALADYGLTGVGFGHFSLVIPAVHPAAIWNVQTPHAHNLFLQIGMDLGIPGMILYGWLVITALRILVDIIRKDGYIDIPALAERGQDHRDHPQHIHSRARVVQRQQRVYERRQASLRWALATGTLAAIVALLVHGLVDAVTWGTKLAFLPWLFYALTALLAIQEMQETRYEVYQ